MNLYLKLKHTLILLFAFGVCTGHSTVHADEYAAARNALVAREIEAAGVANPRVLAAMRTVPRHKFVPAGFRKQAYLDAALPIGDRQTISPPFVVAYMTEQLNPKKTDKVLEIGTGSGYQAAVLSSLVKEVYTIEIVEHLGKRARRTLRLLGYDNIHTKIGDGFQGWPEHAPFDKIIVTCSPEAVPRPLIDQLAEGGEMIVPVGERYQQNLYRLTKRDGKLTREPLRATLFVPMTGAAEEAREVLPDPQHPKIANGGFEHALGKADPASQMPAGWHYLRQAKLVASAEAPEGKRFLRFENRASGEPTRALQGLPLDGRAVARLRFGLKVRGKNLQPGPTPEQAASAIITFYDSRRAAIGYEELGPWQGSFEWEEKSKEVSVPLSAREAIVRLGLHGGAGVLDVDDLHLQAVE